MSDTQISGTDESLDARAVYYLQVVSNRIKNKNKTVHVPDISGIILFRGKLEMQSSQDLYYGTSNDIL